MEVKIEEIQAIETEMLKEVSEICEKHKIDYYLAYGSVLGAVRHGGPIPWDTDLDIIVPINQFDIFEKLLYKELSDKFYFEYYNTNKLSTPLFGRIGLKGYSTRVMHIDVFKLIGMPVNKEEQSKIQKKLTYYQSMHYLKRVQKWDLINYSIKGKMLIKLKKLLTLPISTKRIEKKHDYLCNLYPSDKANKVANASGGYGKKEITGKEYYGKGALIEYSGLKVRIPEKYEEYLRHFYGDYMKFPPENERQIKKSYTIVKLS